MVEFVRNVLARTFEKNSVVISFLVFLSCAISGPFGTFVDLSFSERMVFWGTLVFFASVVGGACCQLVWQFVEARRWILRAFLTATSLALVFTPFSVWFSASTLLVNHRVPQSAVETFAFVFSFGFLVTGYILFMKSKENDTSLLSAKLYERLPNVGNARITRLTAKDHYVIVYMNDGATHRVLMRFSDAISEMEGADGFCTHRSHWVAKDSVTRAVRQGTKEFVVLNSGMEIPVSKTYRDNVVAAGYL